jgi:imidazolonepropionase-like amidohydrolase
MEGLPTYVDATAQPTTHPWRNRRRRRRTFRVLAIACLFYFGYYTFKISNNIIKPLSTLSIDRLEEDYAACSALRNKPAAQSGTRDHNKRWVGSTKPLLIRNATIWTGEPRSGTSEEDARAGKGWQWISSDLFVDKGLIKKVAHGIKLTHLPHDTEVFDVRGRQLTAGIVDMHSHAGLGSVGNLQDDSNELSSDITPYVKSIDGIDALQPEMEFIKSGGVTTSLFLPGSGNNIGGEAFVLKFAVGPKNGRNEISQQDMLADPDKTWRYMKMACGENPKRVYGEWKYTHRGPFSRLGEAWQFRHALEQAQNYVQEQDDWCNAADTMGVHNMQTYLRQDLEWESLGAVLRGQVRINAHCYTIQDLEAFVRHTNEFKFRVYAFHHAHQTYLVPEMLKRAWGGTPAAALFADNMYYKVEAYTASERAGAILYAQNITPTYVSDNPVLNSQHVVFEAAKAYGNGLPYHAALAGVTSAPADLLGLGDRIGKIKPGYDADIVVWDSDPLSVGATPVQVWIDGAPQFQDPIELKKNVEPPLVLDVDLENELEKVDVEGDFVFTGIKYVHRDISSQTTDTSATLNAIINNGKLTCVGSCTSELSHLSYPRKIHLKNGYLILPFTAFGTALGLKEIDAEKDTHDGPPPAEGIISAMGGLFFNGKQLTTAYSHGVTRAISAPTFGGIDARGLSVGFHTGAKNRLEEGALWNEQVALHYPLTLRAKDPSISKAFGDLKAKLLSTIDSLYQNETDARVPLKDRFEEPAYLKRVVQGTLPLVLSAHSADTIASIIKLKHYVEYLLTLTPNPPNKPLRIIIVGGAEAHLVATELAVANISLVLAPLLPHAQSWDQRRGLTGPPLTNVSTNILLDAGVLLGISVEETWETRDLGLLAGIVWKNSEGRLEFDEALGLVGGNFGKMLGHGVDGVGREEVEGEGDAYGGVGEGSRDWVVWEGSPLEIGARVRAIGGAGKTSVWE